MVIISKSNSTVKEIKSLLLKKNRDETGLFVAEGLRLVSDIMSYSPELVKYVAVSETCSESINLKYDYVISDQIFDSITETKHSQGVLAVISKPLCKSIGSDYLLFLDAIRDPGNLGTIIRTAAGAGYTDIILNDCADEYSGKCVRSTMSAIVKVNILHSSFNIIEILKEMGYNVIGADMRGENVFSFQPKEKICLVIGGEANGISGEVKSLLDSVVSIPMDGDIESLNAAISAGILMYNLKYSK